MKVVAINQSGLPDNIEPYVRNVQITVNKEYLVFGIATFSEGAFLLVLDEQSSPVWLPQHIFRIVNRDIPRDWVCNILDTTDAENDVFLLLGPPFVTINREAYNSLVQLETDSVAKFWDHVRATDLG